MYLVSKLLIVYQVVVIARSAFRDEAIQSIILHLRHIKTGLQCPAKNAGLAMTLLQNPLKIRRQALQIQAIKKE